MELNPAKRAAPGCSAISHCRAQVEIGFWSSSFQDERNSALLVVESPTGSAANIGFYCHVTLLSLSPTDSTDIGFYCHVTLLSLSPTDSTDIGFYCHVTLLSLSPTDSTDIGFYCHVILLSLSLTGSTDMGFTVT